MRGPSPAAILAQLAEEVSRQIRTGSHVRFDAALDDLVEYHRFLLEAYATIAENGEAESYARMRVSWRSPHQEWLSVYFDAIDAALKRFSDDSHFISTLSYLPVRLMPRGNEYGSPQPGDDVLNLAAILVYRLEAWHRASARAENDEAVPGAIRTTAYDDLLMAIASAWEGALQYAPALRDHENIGDPQAKWHQFTQGSSFLLRHLQISGEMLLAAVWNRDLEGEARFRDLLLRWPVTTGLRSYEPFLATWQPAANTALLADDWVTALNRASGALPDATPDAVFGTILENTQAHLATVAAALMINWYLVGKTEVAPVHAAQRLLNREEIDADRIRIGRPRFDRDFRHLFFRLLEMHLSGRPGLRDTHGALLDDMASVLDRLSERRVQSGRSYTPSTVHDRAQLSIAFALILTASATPAGVDPILRRLESYLSDEPGLPDGDHTMLAVLGFLENLDRGLDLIDERRAAVLQILNPQIDLPSASQAVRTITDRGRAIIKALRDNRIRERQIDPEKIQRMETLVDAALSAGRGGIPIFRNVAIQRLDDPSIELSAFQFGNVEKSEFVTPPMDYQSSNFFDVVSDGIAQHIAGQVWRAVRNFERSGALLEDPITSVAFWQRVEHLAGQIAHPCLTLHSDDFSAFAERFLYRQEQDPVLRIERDRHRFATPEDRYVATVNGIDLHAIHNQPGQAWLFSAEALSELHYRVLENGLIVTMGFVGNENDPWKGHLDSRFGQRSIWRDQTLLQLQFPSAAVSEVE